LARIAVHEDRLRLRAFREEEFFPLFDFVDVEGTWEITASGSCRVHSLSSA
jgi:hypothetical protein